MKKVDLRKELKEFYNPPKGKISVVDVQTMNYLMINGSGDPNISQSYKGAVEALFSLSYALKFKIKKGNLVIDYSVMPLEGLWWTQEGRKFDINNKSNWQWTAMIMQPEWITEDLVQETAQEVMKKKSLPAIQHIKFESYLEGQSAQILYIGPYADEGPTIEQIKLFIKEQGGDFNGKHHEIYLNDPSRSSPDKLKTIIRQPFKEN